VQFEFETPGLTACSACLSIFLAREIHRHVGNFLQTFLTVANQSSCLRFVNFSLVTLLYMFVNMGKPQQRFSLPTKWQKLYGQSG